MLCLLGPCGSQLLRKNIFKNMLGLMDEIVTIFALPLHYAISSINVIKNVQLDIYFNSSHFAYLDIKTCQLLQKCLHKIP